MHWISVGVAAVNQTPLAWLSNRAHLEACILQARDQGVSLLVTPELGVSGYGCEDAFLGFDVPAYCAESLEALAPHTKGIAAVVGLPFEHLGLLYNGAALLADGELVGIAAKHRLAGDGVHYEPRWFKPWPKGRHAEAQVGRWKVPIGDLIFELGDVRIGMEICEDAWVADRRGAEFPEQGVDLVANPSASHFAFGKYHLRRKIVEEGSRTMGAAYLYANLLGNEAGRIIYDGDTLIAAHGRLISCGRRFSFKQWHISQASVDIDALRHERSQRYSLGNSPDGEAEDLPGSKVVHRDFTWGSAKPQLEPSIGVDRWEFGEHGKEEAFARATALGLFDYIRKAHARGVVISLSGGADSASVALLCDLALKWAEQERGKESLCKTFGLDGGQPLASQWITTAYQASANSGEATLAAARTLAEGLGATFYNLDIESLVDGYRALIEKAVDTQLNWEEHDLALQNIQARSRGPSVWMLANLKGAILLATSNRSETAVGYTTMDGDTCGGLSPIAGIDKAFIRQWLRWMENEGPEGIGPYPCVGLVNAQVPTAELRPADQQQTDEDDLMPYEVLDQIERWAIGTKRGPQDCLALAKARFPNADEEELRTWVNRFFRLWTQNQWKRERFAPSFHLDDENLDPKTWCRFPILSGAFEKV